MKAAAKNVLAEALRLNVEERAELAAKLIASLDGEADDADSDGSRTAIPRKLEAAHRSRTSRSKYWVIQPVAGVPQAGMDILACEVGKIDDDLLGGESGSQKIKDVDHPDPHPANTGAATTLLRVHGDPVCKFCHRAALRPKCIGQNGNQVQ